ncbi:MAG TPA: lamin tail domain-containing protein, partial [Anaerolineales bacterium]|nr:lamin tail domain-containing protein [Anaerolineales bacterium]
FPRFALVLILLISLCASLFAPKVDGVEAKPNKSGTMQIIINEIAWAGTQANVNAEWIELYNPNAVAINLNGWTLRATDGTPNITLTGVIPANGFYLLERTADTTVNDITADQIYTGALGNVVENLELRDSGSVLIDTANEGGVAWFAGNATGFFSMERIGIIADSSFSWVTNNGIVRNGVDSGGNSINGTPKQINSFVIPTSTPTNTNTPTITFTPTETLTPSLTPTITNTPIFSLTPSLTPAPGEVIISEVAWAGTRASPDDEWIELYNTRPFPINLNGWRLVNSSGSVDILLSSIIPANGFLLFERGSNNTVSNILVPANQIYTGALADTNDFLRLRKPDGTIIDTANANSGSWPAGGGSNSASMERYLSGSTASTDNDFGWLTSTSTSSGVDAAGNPIYGTPGNGNVTFTVTATFTPIVTATSTPAGVRSVIINEVAWAGTASGFVDDEWIELYNTTNAAINITGWRITASDGTPNITLTSIIPAGGYFLLERGENLTDNTTVSDIPADQIYTGNALSNSGEALTLYDASNKVIDTANGNGGAWPRGSSSTYGTMERILGTADSDSAWITNTGVKRNGLNANGGIILGTPKQSNTVGPTPTPTRPATITSTPTFPIDPRPIINEILPRPGFDWNQDGEVNVYDEFIEIKNLSPIDIKLNGWRLDKGAGSTPFSLPNITLKPNERIVFYSSETNLLLSDGGETIRLLNASSKIYDAYTYTVAKEADKSICRLPDGNVYGGWFDDCLPTPNLSNTREGSVPTSPDGNESVVCNLPDTIPADFFFAECGGYGANIWNPLYWDTLFKMFIQNNTTKWESFIE